MNNFPRIKIATRLHKIWKHYYSCNTFMLFWTSHLMWKSIENFSSSLGSWLKGLWFESWLGAVQKAYKFGFRSCFYCKHCFCTYANGKSYVDAVVLYLKCFPTLLFHTYFEMILSPYTFSQLIQANVCVALHVRLLQCTWYPSAQHEWKQETVVWSLDRCVHMYF